MSNKNTIIVAIVAIVAIGFLVSEFGQVADLTGDISHKQRREQPRTNYIPPPCTDSDGLDFFTPGTVTYGTWMGNDKCDKTGNNVLEMYCGVTYPRTQIFPCPDGCVTTGGIGHCAAAPVFIPTPNSTA